MSHFTASKRIHPQSLWNVGNSFASYTKLSVQSGNREDAVWSKRKGLRIGKWINVPVPTALLLESVRWAEGIAAFVFMFLWSWADLCLNSSWKQFNQPYLRGENRIWVSEGQRAGRNAEWACWDVWIPGRAELQPEAYWEQSTGLHFTTEITKKPLCSQQNKLQSTKTSLTLLKTTLFIPEEISPSVLRCFVAPFK